MASKYDDEDPPVDEKLLAADLACAGCKQPCEEHPRYAESFLKTISGASMVGSVKPYNSHLLVCSGQLATQWASHPDRQRDSWAHVFAQEFETRQRRIGYRVMCSLTEQPTADVTEEEQQSICDVIVFPDMIKYLKIPIRLIGAWIDAHFIQHTALAAIQMERLSSLSAVCVCCHKKRDARCGQAGPLLADEFDRELSLESSAPLNSLACPVFRISHIGGHKWAGNVIVYRAEKKSESQSLSTTLGSTSPAASAVSAYWYGRVHACHVHSIVQQLILRGQPASLQPLLRATLSLPLPTSQSHKQPSQKTNALPVSVHTAVPLTVSSTSTPVPSTMKREYRPIATSANTGERTG